VSFEGRLTTSRGVNGVWSIVPRCCRSCLDQGVLAVEEQQMNSSPFPCAILAYNNR